MKEEEQMKNKTTKRAEKKIETSIQKNKQKEMTLGKNDETERDIREAKPQNVTEDSEKEICICCNKYVETGVQCGICHRWYHYKCEMVPRGNILHM